MTMKKITFKVLCEMHDTYSLHEVSLKYSDTSANEDISFRNHIR